VLRRIFGFKSEEIGGIRIKQLKEELHNSHSSPNIMRTVTSSSMRRDGIVEFMGEKCKQIIGTIAWKEEPIRKTGLDGIIILKYMIENIMRRFKVGSSDSR
jgi:hypothetical protein